MNHEEIKILNRLITSKLESAITSLPTNKSLGPDGFTGEFNQTFKEVMPRFFELFQKKEEGTLPN